MLLTVQTIHTEWQVNLVNDELGRIWKEWRNWLNW